MSSTTPQDALAARARLCVDLLSLPAARDARIYVATAASHDVHLQGSDEVGMRALAESLDLAADWTDEEFARWAGRVEGHMVRLTAHRDARTDDTTESLRHSRPHREQIDPATWDGTTEEPR